MKHPSFIIGRKNVEEFGFDMSNLPNVKSKPISRKHAIVSYDGQKFKLKNLGRNGTKVRDHVLRGEESVSLTNRTTVEIGRFKMIFVIITKSTNTGK
jgi:hypothetical protein